MQTRKDIPASARCYKCYALISTRQQPIYVNIEGSSNKALVCSKKCERALLELFSGDEEPQQELSLKERAREELAPAAAADLERIQIELFELKPASSKGSIEERFIRFHLDNPHVFSALYKLALATKRAGWRHGSINLLFERLRWSYAIKTHGDKFKLSNDLRAYYARALMAYDDELEGFFSLRAQEQEYKPNLDELNLTAST